MLKPVSPMANNTTSNTNTTDLSTDLLAEDVRRINDENAILLLPVITYVAVLMLVGAVGNSIVFYLYKTKSKGTTKGVFISVLATFDLMNCSIVMPFEIYDMRNRFKFESSEFCKIMRFVETALVLSSGFTLLAISVDRYVNLCVRISRVLFTPTRAKKVCLFCVFLSLIFSWPSLIFAGTKKITKEAGKIEGLECTSFSIETEFARYYIYALNIVFLLSLLTMVILYSLIASKLYRRRRGSIHNGLLYLKDSQESKKFQDDQSNKTVDHCGYAIGKNGVRMKGSTLIFYSVTIIFFVGYLPHLITRVLKLANKAFVDSNAGGASEVLYNFLVRSYMLNSALNPFVYSIFHKRFRKDLISAFQKCICCKKLRSQET